VDAPAAKTIGLTERLGVQFRAELFHLFHRAQYGSPQTNLSSPLSFGVHHASEPRRDGSGTPRQAQLAVRLSF
jgi:hypothetical protein